jgi:hypothetical protein
MAQDREHEQALQVTADSLLTEQLALQKRLQQLTLEYESEADVVQQLQSGEHVASAEHAGASTMYSNAVPGTTSNSAGAIRVSMLYAEAYLVCT